MTNNPFISSRGHNPSKAAPEELVRTARLLLALRRMAAQDAFDSTLDAMPQTAGAWVAGTGRALPRALGTVEQTQRGSELEVVLRSPVPSGSEPPSAGENLTPTPRDEPQAEAKQRGSDPTQILDPAEPGSSSV